MGEMQNTRISGQAKMAALCHAKKLQEQYKGTLYSTLRGVDQLAIDEAYDKMIKSTRQVQVDPVILRKYQK